MRVDPADLDRAEPGQPQQRLQQGHVGGHSGDVELGQRPRRAARRLLERATAGDHLGQQRVVARVDGVAPVTGGVDAHAAPGRRLEPGQRAAAGPERAVRLQGLGVDPDLDRDAARQPVQPEGTERGAVGDAEPELDQVQAGDLLCDRVLDLQPGVDLEKRDRVVLDCEFHRGQPGVAGRGDERRRGLGEPRAESAADRRRGDLDQLLRRRCRLQSRSPSMATAPVPSPMTWTSTCRARVSNRSTYTLPSPKAAVASAAHRCIASASSASRVTGRRPRPPPPASRRPACCSTTSRGPSLSLRPRVRKPGCLRPFSCRTIRGRAWNLRPHR